MEGPEVRLQVISEELHNLQHLQDHAGWKMVLDYAEGQVGNRLPAVLTKLETIADIIGQEFEKGEIAGIQLFSRIPDIVCKDLEENIEALEKELGYVEGERTKDSSSGDSGERGVDPGDDGDFEGGAPSV